LVFISTEFLWLYVEDYLSLKKATYIITEKKIFIFQRFIHNSVESDDSIQLIDGKKDKIFINLNETKQFRIIRGEKTSTIYFYLDYLKKPKFSIRFQQFEDLAIPSLY